MERPEHRLLLNCARICSGPARKHLISSCLDEPVDWGYLIQTAGNHGMTAQLFWNLDASCRDAVPQEVFRMLRDHFLKSSRNNLLFTAELIRILKLFNQNQISAIPFKGPSLALSLYENPGLREFGDLDVMVREQNVFPALRLLRELNYQQAPDYRPAVRARVLRLKNHCRIAKTNAPVVVELHWRIMPAYFLLRQPVDRWWQRAVHTAIEGQSVLTFSPEDLLIALCMHGWKHLWRSLAWLGDLARLLSAHPALDWDYIFSEEDTDLRRLLFISLIAAAELLNASVPEVILEMANKDSVAVQLARELESGMFEYRENREPLQFLWFHLRAKSSWADRARFCFRLGTSPVLFEPDVVIPRFLTPFRKLF